LRDGALRIVPDSFAVEVAVTVAGPVLVHSTSTAIQPTQGHVTRRTFPTGRHRYNTATTGSVCQRHHDISRHKDMSHEELSLLELNVVSATE